jgi:SAM-dependent methyltransferase
MQEIFTRIFEQNTWGSAESRSGPGSTPARAADFIDDLVDLLRRLGARVLVDAGCGDFQWAGRIADVVERYVGIDVVADLIARHQADHADARRSFVCGDLATVDLPQADVILSRDTLVHLSFEDIGRVVRNFRRSGSRYLLTTTFVARGRNDDIATGDWRPIDLQAPPFDFPAPIETIDERCTHTGGMYRDKRLALWDLTTFPPRRGS